MGYKDCPMCNSKATVKAVKDTVVFEEEPPMFIHWECINCNWQSPVLPTGITTKAANKLGIDMTKSPEDWRNNNEKM